MSQSTQTTESDIESQHFPAPLDTADQKVDMPMSYRRVKVNPTKKRGVKGAKTAQNQPNLPEQVRFDPQNSKYLNRELAWLEFNRRVLAQAEDPRTPLLERLRFLGIFTSNLDEFFMKRMGLMWGRVAANEKNGKKAKVNDLKALLKASRETVVPMLAAQAHCFQNVLVPELKQRGVHFLQWEELDEHARKTADEYFQSEVYPILTPQAVDIGHPFPFISNLSGSMVISLNYPEDDENIFVRIKIPTQLPHWIEVTNGNKSSRVRHQFIHLREIIKANLSKLFPGMEIGSTLYVRVTRDVTVDRDDMNDENMRDLLEQVSEELRLRRLQEVVRLEIEPNPDPWLLERIRTQLNLKPEQIYEMKAQFDYTKLSPIIKLKLPETKKFPEPTTYSDWTPIQPTSLRGDNVDMFARIRENDILVHHPYESFDQSVAKFIHDACEDPKVLAIKMTVYRTSDDTPFIPLLIKAADSGKQVACLVELKARFDEHRNIRWAHALEDAGVHVVYGVVGVKTHSKTAMVVRRESDGIRCYAHIGTGNYHPGTARLYTDMGLFTCDPDITLDVMDLFNYLTGRSLKADYRKLLVAPVNMKKRFIEMIRREQSNHQKGKPAYILAKMNQLEDPQIIDALYAASQAGVPIDLIVRGFCCLRPGDPKLSPTIRVTSIIGRLLEHSRIFYFQNGKQDPLDGDFFLGSADWMYRNLDERVEATTPVEHPDLKKKLWKVLQYSVKDKRQSWLMTPDGGYQPVQRSARTLGCQERLMRESARSSERRSR